MNQATQRQVQKAINFAEVQPFYAAATLADLWRAESPKVQRELVAVMDQCNLRGYMNVVDGCFVAKVPA